jgi:AraC-like DNA-binding protein
MPKANLDPESFDQFVARIRRNETLKMETIRNVSKSGLRRLFEETFELTPRQKEEIALLEPKDMDELAGRAFILGLVHDASIKLFHEGHSEPNLWIRVRIDKNGFEISGGC